jgi:hypothetical protein
MRPLAKSATRGAVQAASVSLLATTAVAGSPKASRGDPLWRL